MHYLYGSKKGVERRLVATFGSEQQLLAYVRWATVKDFGEHRGKFEQGSALARYDAWEHSTEPLTDDDDAGVVYNQHLACCNLQQTDELIKCQLS